MKIFHDHAVDKIGVIANITRQIHSCFAEIDNDEYVLFDLTWLEINEKTKKFINQNKDKTFLLYSGMDWHNEECRAAGYRYIKNNVREIIPIGNYDGENYFSFWLEFCRQNFDDIPYNHNIKKPYMCLNRKLHRHRVELVELLHHKNLIKHGFVSLGTPDEYSAPTFLKTPILLQNDIVNEEGDEACTYNAVTNDISSFGLLDNWYGHFLNVVTETVIHTDVFISEKTFKPILGYKPFVILGDDNLYNKLHEWGIDTFDDLLGTGYKNKSYTDRIEWIVSVIEEMSKKSTRDLQTLHVSLWPRLKKNKQRLVEQQIKNANDIVNIAEKFKC